MTVLVTGGAGFIGSNYVRHKLENTSDRVIVLDALTYAGNLDNLSEHLNDSNVVLPSEGEDIAVVHLRRQDGAVDKVVQPDSSERRLRFKTRGYVLNEVHLNELGDFVKGVLDNNRLVFVVGSVSDRTLDRVLMNSSDVVVHFAAESHVDRSILGGADFIRTNVYGTFALLDAAREAKHLYKFIHVSTDEVYGHALERPFKEEDPLNPRNPYSASKAAADRMAFAFYETYKLPVVMVRPTNNFGPRQYPEKLIPLMTIRALRNEPLPVYGAGNQRRDWLYVGDTCKAIDLLIDKGDPGKAYNVAGRNERMNIEVVNRILELTGKPRDLIRHVEDRPGHDVRYLVDDARIRELGFQQEKNFDELLEHTVRWYIQNENWWRRILEEDEDYRSFMEAWYSGRR